MDILLAAVILVIIIKTIVVATVVKGFGYTNKTSLLVIMDFHFAITYMFKILHNNRSEPQLYCAHRLACLWRRLENLLLFF